MSTESCLGCSGLASYCHDRYILAMPTRTSGPRPEASRPGFGELTALVFQLVREQRLLLDRRLAPFDLTMQQGAVLLRIARQGGIRPNEMAADVGTDTSGMTRLIDRLEAKHLVVRRPDPADRRSLIIELSEAGKKLAPKLAPIFGSVERDLTTGHSTADLEQARAVLKRLLDNMREARR
jgi:DNA-binding MarR family transcriptional regulator